MTSKERAEYEASKWLNDDRDDAESLSAMLMRVIDEVSKEKNEEIARLKGEPSGIADRYEPRYALIGGHPFTGYTGTTSFTSLSVVAVTNNKASMKKITEAHYDDCGGLLIWVDLETGTEVDS